MRLYEDKLFATLIFLTAFTLITARYKLMPQNRKVNILDYVSDIDQIDGWNVIKFAITKRLSSVSKKVSLRLEKKSSKSRNLIMEFLSVHYLSFVIYRVTSSLREQSKRTAC